MVYTYLEMDSNYVKLYDYTTRKKIWVKYVPKWKKKTKSVNGLLNQWRLLTCLEYTLNPLKRAHWRTRLVPAAAVISALIAARFSNLQLKNFGMFCSTFLKFSTLKILPCPPTISSLYKFIGMFARLSTSSFFGGMFVVYC